MHFITEEAPATFIGTKAGHFTAINWRHSAGCSGRISLKTRICGRIWHVSAIPNRRSSNYLVVEQFWGRAARASRGSLESGRLFYFTYFLPALVIPSVLLAP